MVLNRTVVADAAAPARLLSSRGLPAAGELLEERAQVQANLQGDLHVPQVQELGGTGMSQRQVMT